MAHTVVETHPYRLPTPFANCVVRASGHTCATLLLGRGVHPKMAQHLLGHTSITMTLDRYSHWIPSMGRHAADGMDEALG
jgi:integrase